MTAPESGGVVVVQRAAERRFEIQVDGRTAGFVLYHQFRDELAVLHTEVDLEFAGRGLAGTLTGHVMSVAAEQGLHVLPYCPFARRWLGRHPDRLALVRTEDRQRFGL